MKSNIKLINKIFISSIVFINSASWANNQEDEKKSSFQREIDRAKIQLKLNMPTLELLNKRFLIDTNVRINSKPSYGEKYSGIDKFIIKGTLKPELFGLNKLPFNLGINDSREITFIKQYDSQNDSIFHKPYNPFKKLPLDTTAFVNNSDKNETTFNIGDYLQFKAPLTLSVSDGANFLQEISQKYKLPFTAGIYLKGEFTVEVFRLSEEHVRVKLSALDENKYATSLPLQILNVVTDGTAYFWRKVYQLLFESNLISMNIEKNDITHFFFDYIINIKTEEGKNIYNSLFGEKMDWTNKSNFSEHLKMTNSFRKVDDRLEIIATDFSKIDESIENSKHLPLNERPVINLVVSKSLSKNNNSNLQVSLFNLAKAREDKSQATIQIQFNDNINNTIDRTFRVDQDRTYQNSKFYSLRETEFEYVANLVTETKILDPQAVARKIIGFSISHHIESTTLKKDDYNKISNHVLRLIPNKLKDKFKLPEIKDNEISLTLNHEISFMNHFFKIATQFTKKQIEEELINVLTSGIEFKSYPYGTDQYTDTSDSQNINFHKLQLLRQGILNEKDKQNYLEIYSEDLKVLPSKIELILNSSKADNFRTYLRSIAYEHPILNEVLPYLFVNLIPDHQLNDTVIIKQYVGINNKTIKKQIFPTKISDSINKKIKEYNNIIRATNYSLRRSFELNDFFNESGDILTLEEMIANTKINSREN